VRIRRAHQQVGTISNDLRSIGALYNWFADQGIDGLDTFFWLTQGKPS
jgi:hypothetical protein